MMFVDAEGISFLKTETTSLNTAYSVKESWNDLHVDNVMMRDRHAVRVSCGAIGLKQ